MKTLEELRNSIRTTQELLDLGYNAANIAKLKKTGTIHCLRRGAYCHAKHWKTLTSTEKYLCDVLAHYELNPATHAYTHTTAAAIHGLALYTTPRTIHAGSTYRTGRKDPKVSYHHTPQLLPETKALLPVSSLLDTVIQCATTLPLSEALIIADSALAQGLNYDDAQEALNNISGHGHKKVHRIAELMSPLCESPGESITRVFLQKHGYPPATEQFVIHREDGKSYRPDFAWVEQRIILEFDGNIKYRNFGDSEDVYARQNEREAWLRAQGWNVVRTNWQEVLYQPYLLKAKLDAAFKRAGR